MIKHIVFFKVNEGVNKDKVIKELKIQLESLPALIHQIKYFEVGINFSQSPNAFDISIISEFDSIEDLKTYASHPEHIKVVALINKNTCDRKVVDYEV